MVDKIQTQNAVTSPKQATIAMTTVSNDKNFQNSIMDFSDSNSDGKIDAGDVVKYKDKDGKIITTTIDEMKDDPTFLSSVIMKFKDGLEQLASKSNLKKADSVLKFEQNNVTKDGKDLKINTKLEGGEAYDAVESLINDSNSMVGGPKKVPELVKNLKASPDGNKYTQTTSEAGNSEGTSAISSFNTLNLAGFRKFVEAPISEQLKVPLKVKDLDDADWRKH